MTKCKVKINKEIRDYTEAIFFGLSLRQFIFSVLACGIAVGLYFLLRPYINVNIKMYIFDHLRMYIFAILPLDRYIFLSDKIFL